MKCKLCNKSNDWISPILENKFEVMLEHLRVYHFGAYTDMLEQSFEELENTYDNNNT